jgi:hypothetical protein
VRLCPANGRTLILWVTDQDRRPWPSLGVHPVEGPDASGGFFGLQGSVQKQDELGSWEGRFVGDKLPAFEMVQVLSRTGLSALGPLPASNQATD